VRPLRYYVTDRSALGETPLVEVVQRVLASGVELVQVREKDLGDRALYDLVCRTVRLARRSEARIVVNGRADVAVAAGAAGVHLPAQGLRVADLRSRLPAPFLIGASAHSLAEARRAARQGADYVLLGPIFATPAKLRYGPPLGLELLARVCRELRAPVLGLGGITPERIAPVLAAGAAGLAGITLFQREALAAPRAARLLEREPGAPARGVARG
jgi:thiamine-phosphate pyrophosphorylase